MRKSILFFVLLVVAIVLSKNIAENDQEVFDNISSQEVVSSSKENNLSDN